MRHLKFITALSILVSAPAITAQTPADTLSIVKDIEQSENITLILPAGITDCLAPKGNSHSRTENADETSALSATAASSRANTRVGYRVQVFDDNNVMSAKHDAQSRRQQLEARFPEFRTYVQFNSPYWKVKVGDFRTRSEADAAMAAIRSAFPSFASQLRVVRDRINP
ncbi:MAG: SPOR domain-containing protein [Muribaculaceae bacterium]|nr:SPOR domain-containing protein [Muribaculaceae bacterium]